MNVHQHMTASIRYCLWDDDSNQEDVVISQPFFYSERWNLTMPERVAHEIAATRNIAATWDIVRVRVDDEDITDEVKEAYDRLYVVRREEFLNIGRSKADDE